MKLLSQGSGEEEKGAIPAFSFTIRSETNKSVSQLLGPVRSVLKPKESVIYLALLARVNASGLSKGFLVSPIAVVTPPTKAQSPWAWAAVALPPW